MDKYTIYCTEEQTRKALELGAPIDNIQHYASINKYYVSGNHIYDNGKCYFFPTAEQMISWLEEQGFDITISSFSSAVDYAHVGTLGIYTGSRKEATLAAIDAALEYLMNNKK